MLVQTYLLSHVFPFSDNGHLEGTMKLRLKDTQLVRTQNKITELEKQIEEWKMTGIITTEAAMESTSAPAASSSAPAASKWPPSRQRWI